MGQVIISIGREFGSAGHEIAQKLSEHYNMQLYDRNLLKAIAAEKNVGSDVLEEFDEKMKIKLFHRTVKGMSSSPQDNVANLQFEFLKDRANSGESFIVVGRCSETILKGYPSLITIFITGDMEHKISRIKKLYDMSDKEAERFIEEQNLKRKMYHNSHCKSKWGDSRNYDLTINSSKLGVDGSIKLLIDYIDARLAQ